RANPTVRKKSEGRRHGARLGLIKETDQLAWLARKGEQGGFQLGGCVAVDEKIVQGIRQKGVPPLSFRSILFEGTLTITDPELFNSILAAGIGSGKAFGFGLLSVARE